MPIFHLTENGNADLDEWGKAHNSWYSPYSPHGFVIIAGSSQDARKMAAEQSSNEMYEMPWWLDEKVTGCTEVRDGPPRIVLGDWPTG